LVKRTKFTHFERWRTKLVKSFDEGLIPNFAETWGTKNIFNPKYKHLQSTPSPSLQIVPHLIQIHYKNIIVAIHFLGWSRCRKAKQPQNIIIWNINLRLHDHSICQRGRQGHGNLILILALYTTFCVHDHHIKAQSHPTTITWWSETFELL